MKEKKSLLISMSETLPLEHQRIIHSPFPHPLSPIPHPFPHPPLFAQIPLSQAPRFSTPYLPVLKRSYVFATPASLVIYSHHD